jgi:hypothetical protein
MVLQATRLSRMFAFSLTSIASRLAPTRRLNNGRGSITERPYNTLIPANPFNASSADLSSRTAKLSKPHWRMWLS